MLQDPKQPEDIQRKSESQPHQVAMLLKIILCDIKHVAIKLMQYGKTNGNLSSR